MALAMTVQAADGRMVADAYWVPAQINIGVADQGGLLTFYGYASREARDEGRAPIAGAVKQYVISREQFIAMQSTPLAVLFPDGGAQPTTTMYEVQARFVYGIARTFKDVPVLNPDGTPQLDSQNKPVMRSFFEEAQNV